MKNAKLQLVCGAIAGPLFILTFIIEDALRAHYNPVHNLVSSLEYGRLGWIQVGNFLITGVLVMVFAIGLWRRYRTVHDMVWGAWLIGILAIGIIGAGIFTTDAVLSHPAATTMTQHSTFHGLLHKLFSVGAFFVLPASSFVVAHRLAKWRLRGWAIYSVLSGIGTLVFFFLSAYAIAIPRSFIGDAGLYERISIIIGLSWLSLFAIKLLRFSLYTQH